MRNQPFHSTFHEQSDSADSLIDPPIAFRFRVLGIVFVAATVVVLVRIAWVQTQLQDRYLDALNATTTEYELIPARDGRILMESANVLATDIDQYSVQVHYRWLQNPVNSDWLTRQVRQKLSRQERKNPTAVQACQSEIESARHRMWQRLATTIGLTSEAFSSQQAAIQQRVQRIADSVNRRRAETSTTPEYQAAESWWMKVATTIRRAVTTTPRRGIQDRIVVREEESWHEIASGVSLDIAGIIREQDFHFPGVRVVAGNRRIYPNPNMAAHLVGARTAVKDDERQDNLPTTTSDIWQPRIGRFGVERMYDHQIRSVPGLRRIVRNRRMEIVESEIEQQPVSGRDLLLTLNFDLQQVTEQLLAEALMDQAPQLLSSEDVTNDRSSPQPIPTGGSIVVMDVQSGRIIAAASGPSFSLSLYTGATAEQWAKTNSDQRHPFLNRYVQTALPPGSAIKPITAAAVVESGAIDPDRPFQCQGYLTQPNENRCLIFRLYGRGHDDITLPRALAESCNVYFFSAARSAGFRMLRNWNERFGFGRTTGIDLPFEVRGNLPGSETADATTEHQLQRETLGLSIGQSSTTATPIQMVRAYAAIANGGWLVTPHVVSPDGTARVTTDVDDRPRALTRRKISGLSKDTLKRITEGLTATVEAPYGSGYRTVRLDSVAIAGKTGTAETQPNRPDHAWFAGFVPAEQPRFAFVVVLEHGGSGSRAAGPVARELVRAMVDLRLVPPAAQTTKSVESKRNSQAATIEHGRTNLTN